MTMRIALAGAGGFAYILAQELSKSANAVLVLSRQVESQASTLLTKTNTSIGTPRVRRDHP